MITSSNTTDREEKRREEVFSVTEVMRALVAGDVSYIETTVTQLRDQPHAAWAALFYSCAPRGALTTGCATSVDVCCEAAIFVRSKFRSFKNI